MLAIEAACSRRPIHLRPLPRAACRRNRDFMLRDPGKRGRRRDTARGGSLCVGDGRLADFARQESDRAGVRSRHAGESADASNPARPQRIAVSASPAPDAGVHRGAGSGDSRASRASTTSKASRASRAPKPTAHFSTSTRAPNPTATARSPPTSSSRPTNRDARASMGS